MDNENENEEPKKKPGRPKIYKVARNLTTIRLTELQHRIILDRFKSIQQFVDYAVKKVSS